MCFFIIYNYYLFIDNIEVFKICFTFSSVTQNILQNMIKNTLNLFYEPTYFHNKFLKVI